MSKEEQAQEAYERPTVEVLGSLQQITSGSRAGTTETRGTRS